MFADEEDTSRAGVRAKRITSATLDIMLPLWTMSGATNVDHFKQGTCKMKMLSVLV